ncbi:MAG: sigma-70 family RNA polymerase sigma factor [Oscillospiraceae bacterium]|nr:sigma-70 family RNA polymerase sigma factor [Oscillospiraceae bacterium]
MQEFQDLVNTNYAKVFYHTLKQVGNDHDAADIAQNTFFKAFLRYGSLQKPESAAPWLFVICNNEIKQHFRQAAKQQTTHPNQPQPTSHATLYAAIEQLSQAQRQVVLLKYFGGYTMQELSVALDISTATVKSRLYEARQALKRLLSTPSPTLQSKRRKNIMSTINLCDIGSKTIPCLSLNAQKQLLQCAKDNVKFTESMLAELADIDTGKDFLVACNGSVSYDELVKILACCDDATVYRLSGKDYKAWRSISNSPLAKDIAALQNMGGYIDSVEPILYVPSLLDTCHWYKKYLNWGYGTDEDGIEKYCHATICPQAHDDLNSPYQNFKGFHLRQSQSNDVPIRCGAFIFVSGLAELHTSIIKRGWSKITKIRHNNWGTDAFNVEDLNGFTLEFCEWRCENPSDYT